MEPVSVEFRPQTLAAVVASLWSFHDLYENVMG